MGEPFTVSKSFIYVSPSLNVSNYKEPRLGFLDLVVSISTRLQSEGTYDCPDKKIHFTCTDGANIFQ